MIEGPRPIIGHSFQSLVRAGRPVDLESVRHRQLDTRNANLTAGPVDEDSLTRFSVGSKNRNNEQNKYK